MASQLPGAMVPGEPITEVLDVSDPRVPTNARAAYKIAVANGWTARLRWAAVRDADVPRSREKWSGESVTLAAVWGEPGARSHAVWGLWKRGEESGSFGWDGGRASTADETSTVGFKELKEFLESVTCSDAGS